MEFKFYYNKYNPLLNFKNKLLTKINYILLNF